MNVKLEYNRRQRISITCADMVIIKNCVFSNTGNIEVISHGAGMDIEPNEGQGVRHASVYNCEFSSTWENAKLQGRAGRVYYKKWFWCDDAFFGQND